jgi:hypothetical protein
MKVGNGGPVIVKESGTNRGLRYMSLVHRYLLIPVFPTVITLNAVEQINLQAA